MWISKYGLIKELVVLNIAIRMGVWCHWGWVNGIIMNAKSEMNAFFFQMHLTRPYEGQNQKNCLYYTLCHSMALNVFRYEAPHPTWPPPNAFHILYKAQAMCVRIVNYCTHCHTNWLINSKGMFSFHYFSVHRLLFFFYSNHINFRMQTQHSQILHGCFWHGSIESAAAV